MAIDQQEFQKIFTEYERIKDCYAVRRLKFYAEKVDYKRKLAQVSGWVILALSLLIPLVSNLENFKIQVLDVLKDKTTFIVSVMSLMIAFISGLEQLHQWRKTWQDYSKAIVDIETFINEWEIEVAAAKQLPNPEEVNKKLKVATQNLVRKVELTVETEMGGFFAARNKDQVDQ